MSEAEVDDGGHPTVTIHSKEGEVLDKLLLVLEERKWELGLYERGRQIVRVAPGGASKLKWVNRPPLAPAIQAVGMATLRTELTRHADFQRYVKAKASGAWVTEPAHPPEWLVRALVERGHWPIHEIQGLVEAPVLLMNGEVLQAPGYHPESGLFFSPAAGVRFLPVSDQPTASEVKEALGWLCEAVCDFPLSPAHRSAWYAGVLSYFGRWAFKGPTPLFLVSANAAGVGKQKLVYAAARICLGRDPTDAVFPSNAEDEAKFFTTVAVSGEAMVNFDNLVHPLGSDRLDNVLTKTTYDAHLLYSDEMHRMPWYTILWANGNNVQFRKHFDTARRTLLMFLNSHLERPENRGGFRHDPLYDWIDKNRPKLVWAALTLLRAYVAAGSPSMGLAKFGSYEEWSALVRNALVWAGEPDPYEAAASHDEEADTVLENLGPLLEGWRSLCESVNAEGLTAHEALAELHGELEYRRLSTGHQPRFQSLIEALLELCPVRGGAKLPTSQDVGYMFKKYKGKVVSGMRLENRKSADGSAKGSKIWLAGIAPNAA